MHRLCLAAVSAVLLLSACASARRGEHAKPTVVNVASLEPLDQFIAKQERRSWDLLKQNISPVEPKVAGGPKPARGIVVAALSRKDPDYYFHWIRDSSNVMRVVVESIGADRPYTEPERFPTVLGEYIKLSRRLQTTPSAFGMGEPRYQVTGEPDTLPWSRPQFDGPALRALSVLKYLSLLDHLNAAKPQVAPDPLALQVLRTDLDFVAAHWQKRGFDVWEELNGDHYHTRLVQLSALEHGAEYFQRHAMEAARSERYLKFAARLEAALNDHWDAARGYMKSQMAVVATDGYTAKKTDLDSAVVVAVVEADRNRAGHSVLDDRVQASVAVLENLFRQAYPLNAQTDLGLAYGRYQGDHYYGGNPWFLITAYYAEFYDRLARKLQQGAAFTVTQRNLEFVRRVVSGNTGELTPDTVIQRGSPWHRQLISGCVQKADLILRRVQAHTPGDGQFYEQYKLAHFPADGKELPI